MDCSAIKQLLPEHACGDLPERLSTAVEKHLEQCYKCHEELLEIVDLLDHTRAVLQHPNPMNQFERLQKAIRCSDETANLPLTIHLTPVAFIKFATAAVIFIFTSVGIYSTFAPWYKIIMMRSHDNLITTTDKQELQSPVMASKFLAHQHELDAFLSETQKPDQQMAAPKREEKKTNPSISKNIDLVLNIYKV